MLKRPTHPYPGKRAYSSFEHKLFYGRDLEIEELRNKIRKEHFVALVAPSYGGKTSLVQAGLIPILTQDGYMAQAGLEWKCTIVRPDDNPLRALAKSIARPNILHYPNRKASPHYEDNVYDILNENERGLVEVYRRSEYIQNYNLLLVIDNAENIFSEKTEDNIQKQFIDLLLYAAKHKKHSIYVLWLINEENLEEYRSSKLLMTAIVKSHYYLHPLSQLGLLQAIKKPLKHFRVGVEDELCLHLVKELTSKPQQLHKLQTDLTYTWNYWTNAGQRGSINMDSYYKAMGITQRSKVFINKQEKASIPKAQTQSVTSADERAESILKRMNRNQKLIIAKIFKALTNDKGQAIEVVFNQLVAILGLDFDALQAVLDEFRIENLICPTSSEALMDNSIVTIVNTDLLKKWKRIKVWAKVEKASVELYLQLDKKAINYYSGATSEFIDFPELQTYLDWQQKNKPNAAWAKRYGGNFADALQYLLDSEYYQKKVGKHPEPEKKIENPPINKAAATAKTPTKVRKKISIKKRK